MRLNIFTANSNHTILHSILISIIYTKYTNSNHILYI